jgi:hypothetical protein
MSNLTCPGCGSVYPLSAVSRLDQFKCAVCHTTIVVPIAGPAPSRAAQPSPPAPPSPPPAYAAPSPQHASPPVVHSAPRQRRPVREEAPKSSVNGALIGTGVAVLAAAVAATYVLARKSEPDKPAAPPPSVVAPVKPPEPVAAPKPDPMKSVAAWKALGADERADLTTKYLASLDRGDLSGLSTAYSFLKARDELEAGRKVGEMALRLNPSCDWAHMARGDVMILERIERCLADCPRAEQAETPSVKWLAKLAKERRPEKATWWVEPALAKEVDGVLEKVREDEKRLQDPFEWGVARWRMYQSRIEVMKEHPAISEVAGPYLLFVQVKAPLGTPIESVPEIEMTRAKRVLAAKKTLFTDLYDAFHESFGKSLGLTKYDKSNLDYGTLLKANVFADETTWNSYHQRLGFGPLEPGLRAWYDVNEPRFLTTFDGDAAISAERSTQIEQAQCRSALRQLLHFHTWDASRKEHGRELTWAECRTRPLWLEEGFVEFFASHSKDGGRRVWMQPNERRMEELWAWSQALAKKRWAGWTIDELLAVVDRDQMIDCARRRVVPKPVKQLTEQQVADLRRATAVMQPLFCGKAWSLVSYLWNQADTAGRPLYREQFRAFIGSSIKARQANVPGRGLVTQPLNAQDFRKAFELEQETRFRAFEKDWLAWEAAQLAKAQKPDWAETRDRAVGELTGK